MSAALPRFRALFALLIVLGSAAADVRGEPPDTAAKDAEIARLRARVAELEAENARLRGDASVAASFEAAADKDVRVTFDEGSGTTTIATEPSRLVLAGGSTTRHWLTFQAKYPGRTRTAAVADALLVVETSASAGEYRRATALRLVVDGKSEQYAVVRYATEPITAGRQPLPAGERETVAVSLPSAALARMAGGRDVRAGLGTKEFTLTPAQLSTLRAFRKRLEG